MKNILKNQEKISKNKSSRNSNLELLRIISMILIVAHHYSVHGFTINDMDFSRNKYIVDFLSLGGKLGVNCFILISGYFSIKSKFTIKKLFKLEGQVLFYSISFLVLFLTVLTPIKPIGIKLIIKSFLPIIYNCYWFVTTYIILMILSPYINILILNMNKIIHAKLICILVLIFSIIQNFTLSDLSYSNLGWFMILYLIAAYIRKYVDISNINLKLIRKITTITTMLLFLSVIVFNYIGNKYNIDVLLKNSRYFGKDNSILILIISVGLFLICLSYNWHNSIINRIASTTFGVYLIHENYFVRPFIWETILHCKENYYSNYLIIHAICSIIIVYISCTLIELLRQITIEKVYFKLLESNKINSLIMKVNDIVRDKAKLLARFFSKQ